MNTDEFSWDDFNTEAESTEVVESETVDEQTEIAESNQEPSETPEEAVKEDTPSQEQAMAESQKDVYSPDFTYKIKDEQKEFPEWMREAIKNKELEDQARDIFTKADALESVKESRANIETQFNSYKQDFETRVAPTLQKIGQFDQALKMKDFKTAWELSGQNPKDVIDYMLQDENLSNQVYEKVLAQIEQGPQAQQSSRANWEAEQRQRQLEMSNQNYEKRIAQMEAQQFNSMLEFGLNQNQAVVSQYDSIKGQGAFEKFVREYGHMKHISGQKITPAQAINDCLSMANLSSQPTQPTQPITPTQETVIQAPTQPIIPNMGTGANVSVVDKVATSWDDWEARMASA